MRMKIKKKNRKKNKHRNKERCWNKTEIKNGCFQKRYWKQKPDRKHNHMGKRNLRHKKVNDYTGKIVKSGY